mmetsp:Transcript_68213/g.148505  ORF Transcript_68213/g.148505 Transcript_68213/m.148505 type:complete len:246 (-) Transcript_68213:574-1311(-)
MAQKSRILRVPAAPFAEASRLPGATSCCARQGSNARNSNSQAGHPRPKAARRIPHRRTDIHRQRRGGMFNFTVPFWQADLLPEMEVQQFHGRLALPHDVLIDLIGGHVYELHQLGPQDVPVMLDKNPLPPAQDHCADRREAAHAQGHRREDGKHVELDGEGDALCDELGWQLVNLARVVLHSVKVFVQIADDIGTRAFSLQGSEGLNRLPWMEHDDDVLNVLFHGEKSEDRHGDEGEVLVDTVAM